ncbi:hypothetical protein Bca101_081582 [Brassica carinata]
MVSSLKTSPRRTFHREISILQGESLQAFSLRRLRINSTLVRNPFFKSQSPSCSSARAFSIVNSASLAAVLAAESERSSDLCIYSSLLFCLPVRALDLHFCVDYERRWFVKDWLLIAFSWSVIKDTGLKAKDAQKKVQARDEEAGKLLEVRESERDETKD